MEIEARKCGGFGERSEKCASEIDGNLIKIDEKRSILIRIDQLPARAACWQRPARALPLVPAPTATKTAAPAAAIWPATTASRSGRRWKSRGSWGVRLRWSSDASPTTRPSRACGAAWFRPEIESAVEGAPF